MSETSRARRSAVPVAPAAALAVAGAFALLRLALAPAFELLPQSAYYFTAYAEHPALSYFDHPPAIAVLLRLGANLFGRTAFGVHLTLWLTTLATQVAFFGVARRILARSDDPEGTGRGGLAVALLASTTMVTLLSFVAVPDVPLLLFWTLAVGALDRALFPPAPDGEGPPAARPGAWLAAGLAMGLALLSKYTAVFLQGGLILFLLVSRRHRRLLATPWPWVSLALAHLVCLPVYVWNARHGFASFLFQSAGRASEIRFDPGDLLGFLGGQAVVLLPVPFAAFLVVAARKLWRLRPGGGPPEPRTLYLLCLSVPLFATCVGLSPFAWVKMNWAMPAYLTGLLLAVEAVGRRGWRWHLAIAGLLHIALAVELLAYPVLPSNQEAWFGWDELAARVAARAAEHPGAFVFAGDNYRTTAELRFYGPRHGLATAYGMNVMGWNALGYEYLGEDLGALAGRDALFLRSEPPGGPSAETDRYVAQARRYFASVREIGAIEIHRHGRIVRRFRVFYCSRYRGPDSPAG